MLSIDDFMFIVKFMAVRLRALVEKECRFAYLRLLFRIMENTLLPLENNMRQFRYMLRNVHQSDRAFWIFLFVYPAIVFLSMHFILDALSSYGIIERESPAMFLSQKSLSTVGGDAVAHPFKTRLYFGRDALWSR